MFNNGGGVEPSIREKLTEEAAKEGGRNDKLARLVGKWIKEGWGMREILIKAQDWNQVIVLPCPSWRQQLRHSALRRDTSSDTRTG